MQPRSTLVPANMPAGFLNKLTAELPTTAVLMVFGAGNGDCTGGSIRGSVSVSCVNSLDGATSSVSLGPLVNTPASSAANPHVYVGCQAPSGKSRCTPGQVRSLEVSGFAGESC